MNRFMKNTFAIIASAAISAACSTQGAPDESLGGETNWLGGCDGDGDCEAGRCICGVCTTPCQDGDDCGGGAPATCAGRGSHAFEASCGDPVVEEGICVQKCGQGSDCQTGLQCAMGVCAATSSTDAGDLSKPDEPALSSHYFTDAVPGNACLPYSLPVAIDDTVACSIFVVSEDPSCDCTDPGQRPMTPAEAAFFAEITAESGVCGTDTGPPCADVCGCAVTQLSGDDAQACRNDPSWSGAGWCYVDPAFGIGTPGLVEDCPVDSRRLLRLGDEREHWTALACGQSESVPSRSTRELGELGAACLPAAVYDPRFDGYTLRDAHVETRTTACESGTCVVHAFQGLQTCPYGNQDGGECRTPEGELVTGVVHPQVLSRRATTASVCSCRCDGPEPSDDYCACPGGFECRPLIPDLDLPIDAQAAGSYCFEVGTYVESVEFVDSKRCDAHVGNCE